MTWPDRLAVHTKMTYKRKRKFEVGKSNTLIE